MKMLQTILHPTDFSVHSKEALALAGSLARDHCARLIVLHAVPVVAPATGPGDAALEHAERRRRDVESYRQEMAEKLRWLDVPAVPAPVERLLEEGEPAAVILRKAEETACDLIVMGTHGRTGALRQLLGSVAEEVTRKATCPVVAVKVPALAPLGQATPEESYLSV